VCTATPLSVVDGTLTTTGDIKHTLLFAVSYDGNNELVHLAYGVCDIENTENWKWFISKLTIFLHVPVYLLVSTMVCNLIRFNPVSVIMVSYYLVVSDTCKAILSL